MISLPVKDALHFTDWILRAMNVHQALSTQVNVVGGSLPPCLSPGPGQLPPELPHPTPPPQPRIPVQEASHTCLASAQLNSPLHPEVLAPEDHRIWKAGTGVSEQRLSTAADLPPPSDCGQTEGRDYAAPTTKGDLLGTKCWDHVSLSRLGQRPALSCPTQGSQKEALVACSK